MKTVFSKINLTFVVIAGIAINLSSCTKSDLSEATQSNETGVTKEILLDKTNGGKRAAFIPVVSEEQSSSINCKVFPPNAHMFGSSYAQWSAKWWKWAMELPAAANHPFNDDPGFNVNMGQTGNVWFLAGVFGTVSRTITVPAHKTLFIGLLNGEASNLEGMGNTYSDRRATAIWQANHITPSSLSCTIDGMHVNVSSYRFVSPEINFFAPTPWIYGATGGNGKSVADGYYVMLKQLSHGTHTVHYTGAFHFTLAADGFDFDASIDMTYHINQQ